MRLSLTEKAALALEAFHANCKELNPDIEPVLATFLSRYIESQKQVLTREQVRDLAVKLTSARIKRKRIAERLLRLGDKLDESDIEKFEAKIERKHTASNSEISAISAEIS